MSLKCILIDDEPSGRKIIEEYVAETPFLQLIGQTENPIKALSLLENNEVDLIFLDIQMPKMNGIDFLKTLKNPPMVILTTAFSEYAIAGFELEVMDYLLKPISFERFLKACHKAQDYFILKNKATQATNYFFVKSNNKFEKIMLDELLFAEAANNYVVLQTKDKRYITYVTFKGIEETLPVEQFIKVHKSFIVSLSKIDNLDREEIKIGQYSIPISRNLKDKVMEKIVNKNLIKRS
jgi:DNA-binding LytR/AlgR family response regulator